MDHSSGSRQHILSEHELSCKYDVTVRIRSHMSLSVLSSIMSLCLHVFTALFSPASLSPRYSWRLMMCERHKFDKRSARSACAHKISHLLLIWFPATSGFEAEFLKQVFVGWGGVSSFSRKSSPSSRSSALQGIYGSDTMVYSSPPPKKAVEEVKLKCD